MALAGKAIGIGLVGLAAVAGAAMYWLQVYAYYDRVELAAPGQDGVTMYVETGAGAEELWPEAFEAIDSTSSPIRFRACFRLAAPEALLARAIPADNAVPLVAPRWFDCFDAAGIGADLAAGRATAVLGQPNVVYGIDRVLAVYPDGRAYAWDQINRCGEKVFDGKPPPPGCPPQEPAS